MERSDSPAPGRERRIASGRRVSDQAPLKRMLRSVALLLAVLLLIVMRPAAAESRGDDAASPTATGFTLLRSGSHVEISGGPEDVPAIVDVMGSLNDADAPLELPVIVFINWRA